MIIGNGLLGLNFNLFKDDFKNYVVFTSGVSNSKEIDINQFNREKELILKTLEEYKELTFIYVSSILAGSTKDGYYNHKLEMEKLIRSKSKKYLIFRVPQIVGDIGNKNNLINFLKENIKNGEEIVIYNNIERAIIDIDDFVKIVNYCKDKTINEIIIISHIEKIKVIDLCKSISSILKKELKFKISYDYQVMDWDFNSSSLFSEALIKLNINNEGYSEKIIKKYIN